MFITMDHSWLLMPHSGKPRLRPSAESQMVQGAALADFWHRPSDNWDVSLHGDVDKDTHISKVSTQSSSSSAPLLDTYSGM